jgi:hypothetical protein
VSRKTQNSSWRMCAHHEETPMKKNKKTRTLKLNTELVRRLTGDELATVAGGQPDTANDPCSKWCYTRVSQCYCHTDVCETNVLCTA